MFTNFPPIVETLSFYGFSLVPETLIFTNFPRLLGTLSFDKFPPSIRDFEFAICPVLCKNKVLFCISRQNVTRGGLGYGFCM